jgi:predicted RNA polymerase sigma factor
VQIALILQILCGFGVGEIAAAFVDTHPATEKRITRAKKALAGSTRLFDMRAPRVLAARPPAVRRALYLLFNEG